MPRCAMTRPSGQADAMNAHRTMLRLYSDVCLAPYVSEPWTQNVGTFTPALFTCSVPPHVLRMPGTRTTALLMSHAHLIRVHTEVECLEKARNFTEFLLLLKILEMLKPGLFVTKANNNSGHASRRSQN